MTKIYPINSIDNLEKIYDKEGNKLFLMKKKDIVKIFDQVKNDISNNKYNLFHITDGEISEIIIVKKKSLHLEFFK